MIVLLQKNQISVCNSVADILLKYRSIWDDEEPIVTEAPTLLDTSKNVVTSETKKILLPDSSICIKKNILNNI